MRNDHEIADAFNDYSSSVATVLGKNISIINYSPLKYLSHVNRPNSSFLTLVTGTKCYHINQKLKLTSFGNASLPVSILKKLSIQLVGPLTAIIRKSFVTGIFPDCLKCADVTPIYKGCTGAIITGQKHCPRGT